MRHCRRNWPGTILSHATGKGFVRFCRCCSILGSCTNQTFSGKLYFFVCCKCLALTNKIWLDPIEIDSRIRPFRPSPLGCIHLHTPSWVWFPSKSTRTIKTRHLWAQVEIILWRILSFFFRSGQPSQQEKKPSDTTWWELAFRGSSEILGAVLWCQHSNSSIPIAMHPNFSYGNKEIRYSYYGSHNPQAVDG